MSDYKPKYIGFLYVTNFGGRQPEEVKSILLETYPRLNIQLLPLPGVTEPLNIRPLYPSENTPKKLKDEMSWCLGVLVEILEPLGYQASVKETPTYFLVQMEGKQSNLEAAIQTFEGMIGVAITRPWQTGVILIEPKQTTEVSPCSLSNLVLD